MRSGSPTLPVRKAVAPIVAVAFVAALMSSCSGGGSPPSDGSSGNAAKAAAVVTDYFVNGIGGGDWAKASALSTGPLKTAAGWLVTQGIASPEEQRGTFSINSMSVVTMGSTEATFDLDAMQTATNYTTRYSGPVSVVKEVGGWKVANYLRDARDAAAAVFPNATGQATRSGVV